MANKILERLQSLHPSHKTKILVGVGLVSLVGLMGIWTSSVKQQLANIDQSQETNKVGSVLSASNYVTLEYTDYRDQKRYVYFKATNNTDQILNFSTPENISFQHLKGTSKLFILTDRQESVFPSKILSNTTVYGIAVFDELEQTTGNMIFDNMYFENTPGQIFKESIFVDFESLNDIQELRS